jgi:hypothetical protein
MNIAWKRGFLRIWILLLLIWQIVPLLFINSRIETVISESGETISDCAQLKTIVGNGFDQLDPSSKDKLLTGQSMDGRLSEITRKDLRLIALYELTFEEGSAFTKSLCESQKTSWWGNFPKVIKSSFLEIIGLSIIPPAIILLAGLAIGWVVRGFNK